MPALTRPRISALRLGAYAIVGIGTPQSQYATTLGGEVVINKGYWFLLCQLNEIVMKRLGPDCVVRPRSSPAVSACQVGVAMISNVAESRFDCTGSLKTPWVPTAKAVLVRGVKGASASKTTY